MRADEPVVVLMVASVTSFMAAGMLPARGARRLRIRQDERGAHTFGGGASGAGSAAGLSGPPDGGALGGAVLAALALAMVRASGVLAWLAVPVGGLFSLVMVRVRGDSLAGLPRAAGPDPACGRIRHPDRRRRCLACYPRSTSMSPTLPAARRWALVWLPGSGVTALVPVETARWNSWRRIKRRRGCRPGRTGSRIWGTCRRSAVSR